MNEREGGGGVLNGVLVCVCVWLVGWLGASGNIEYFILCVAISLSVRLVDLYKL